MLLVGDIPITEKKKRLINSDFGQDFDKRWDASIQDYAAEPQPPGGLGTLSEKQLIEILSALREFGFESYLVPQSVHLPFSYTGEDLLVRGI